MNIDIIKRQMTSNIGKKVEVTIYGMRSKIDRYDGILYKLYNNIFTILYNGEEKSFSYRDIITKDIVLKYL